MLRIIFEFDVVLVMSSRLLFGFAERMEVDRSVMSVTGDINSRIASLGPLCYFSQKFISHKRSRSRIFDMCVGLDGLDSLPIHDPVERQCRTFDSFSEIQKLPSASEHDKRRRFGTFWSDFLSG